MSRPLPPLTDTSYAILGLLAVRPSWTTYELAQAMDRSLNQAWPRARSKLYEEPKKLVEHGLARATHDAVGRRARTSYSISAKGRKALAAWLEEPGPGPSLEFGQLIKVFFGDHGTTAGVLANIRAARAWALERIAVNAAVGREYFEGRGAYPERMQVTVLTGGFLGEFAQTVLRWSEWAEEIVESWPDRPSQAQPDLATLRAVMLRDEQTVRSLQAGPPALQRRKGRSARPSRS